MYKYCERIKPVQCPIQRVPVRCEGMTAYSDLHSGVAALKASRGGRVCPLQLFEAEQCSVNRGGTASNFAPGQLSLFGGFYYSEKRERHEENHRISQHLADSIPCSASVPVYRLHKSCKIGKQRPLHTHDRMHSCRFRLHIAVHKVRTPPLRVLRDLTAHG